MTRRRTSSRPRAIALLAGIALLASLVAAPAAVLADAPTTLFVAPDGDPSHTGADCATAKHSDIASAVAQAFSGDTIHVCTGVYVLASTVMVSQVALFFEGDGASATIVDGGSAHRLFSAAGDNTALTFTGLTLRNGRTPSKSTAYGGAIFGGGIVTVVDSTFTNNSTGPLGGGGGAIFVAGIANVTDSIFTDNGTGPVGGGGAIFATKGATVIGSTFTGNTAGTSDGGAIAAYRIGEPGVSNVDVTDSTFTANAATGGDGGAIYASGAVTATDSTFDRNGAGTINGGAVYARSGGVTIVGTTFTANGAAANGGAIFDEDLWGSGTDVTNSTFVGNSAGFSGGAILDFQGTDTSVANSTFVGNSAGVSGGTIVATATVLDTILAQSSGTGICAGSVTDRGGNFGTDASCGFTRSSSHNSVGLATLALGPLADNGGPTETIALLAGSVAIVAGVAPCPATDQRGVARPDAPTSCDSGAYEATPSGPVISGFTPGLGPVGTVVTIAGTGFAGATVVEFIHATASFTVDPDGTHITASVPVGARSGPISVTTPRGTDTSAADFVVAPTIGSFSPTAGPVGTLVTIDGLNLVGITGVAFNGTPAVFFDEVTPTRIRAIVPPDATTGTISVTVGGQTGVSAGSFTVETPTPSGPVISSFSPAVGPVGTVVTIIGTGFAGATRVEFVHDWATPTSVSATQVTAVVPAGAITGKIGVTTSVGTGTSAADFGVVPTVTGVSPDSGPTTGDTIVTITGMSFAGVTGVSFGTAAATLVGDLSSTRLTVTSPTGTGTVDVTVASTAGTSATSAADEFTYVTTPAPGAPTVTSVSPAAGSGAGGTLVTFTGTDLTGATAVHFGAIAAVRFTIVDARTGTAVSPGGFGTVHLTVTTPHGTSAPTFADRFTFFSTPPWPPSPPRPSVTPAPPPYVPPGEGPSAPGATPTPTPVPTPTPTLAPTTVTLPTTIGTTPASAGEAPITVTTGTRVALTLDQSLIADSTVEVWRRVGTGTWTRITTRRVQPTGIATYTFTATATAAYRYRFTGDAAFLASWGPARAVRVTRLR